METKVRSPYTKSFKVYYAKEPNFGFGPKPTLATLDETHQFVKKVIAEDLGEVFFAMQGEIWSPNGEARELITSLGLHHTSMSVGDVIVNETEKTYWLVEPVGFSELT